MDKVIIYYNGYLVWQSEWLMDEKIYNSGSDFNPNYDEVVNGKK